MQGLIAGSTLNLMPTAVNSCSSLGMSTYSQHYLCIRKSQYVLYKGKMGVLWHLTRGLT